MEGQFQSWIHHLHREVLFHVRFSRGYYKQRVLIYCTHTQYSNLKGYFLRAQCEQYERCHDATILFILKVQCLRCSLSIRLNCTQV